MPCRLAIVAANLDGEEGHVFDFSEEGEVILELDPLPVRRLCVGLVHYRQHIYAIGGRVDRLTNSNALERYDLDTQLWQSWPDLPISFTNPSCAMYKKSIYVLSKFYSQIAVIEPMTMSISLLNSGIE
jgi:hypothetical protein